MDLTYHKPLLFCILVKIALVALLQPVVVIANERTPIYRYFPIVTHGGRVQVVSIAEASDGMLYIGCRREARVIAFDGNNWDEITLPSAPRSLVADRRDRIWISMDDGIGFIQRDALGRSHFQRFALQEKPSDRIVFPVGFKTAKGVRFGSSQLIADIDCSTDQATACLYRAKPLEKFRLRDGESIYSTFKGKDELFQLKNGKRSTVPTEYLPGGVFACRITENRYLFANKGPKDFRIKGGSKWHNFSEDLTIRLGGRACQKFAPLTGDRIGFATPKAFVCYEANGKLLWSVNEEVRRFGELSNGRLWLSGESGFYIVDRIDTASKYLLGSNDIENIRCIDVTEEGVYLSNNSGLFFLELEEKAARSQN